MNTLHGNSTGAVVTRLHDVVRTAEKSGAVSGRGCARGTGRQHTTYMSVVDAHVGGSSTGVTGVAPVLLPPTCASNTDMYL
nr:hypothetical protein [Streptomyces europaeiscabiei]